MADDPNHRREGESEQERVRFEPGDEVCKSLHNVTSIAEGRQEENLPTPGRGAGGSSDRRTVGLPFRHRSWDGVEQESGVEVLRICEHLFRGSALDESAAFHDCDPVAHADQFLHLR
mgnify:FL=1